MNLPTKDQEQQLDEQGYVVLEDCMGVDLLRELRERIHELFDEEGDAPGSEFLQEEHAHRLANLVDKGEVFRRAIVLPKVLECVRHVLGPDCKLSSLNARSADPHVDVRPAAARRHGGDPRRARATGSATPSGCSTTSRPRTARRA